MTLGVNDIRDLEIEREAFRLNLSVAEYHSYCETGMKLIAKQRAIEPWNEVLGQFDYSYAEYCVIGMKIEIENMKQEFKDSNSQPEF